MSPKPKPYDPAMKCPVCHNPMRQRGMKQVLSGTQRKPQYECENGHRTVNPVRKEK